MKNWHITLSPYNKLDRHRRLQSLSNLDSILADACLPASDKRDCFTETLLPALPCSICSCTRPCPATCRSSAWPPLARVQASWQAIGQGSGRRNVLELFLVEGRDVVERQVWKLELASVRSRRRRAPAFSTARRMWDHIEVEVDSPAVIASWSW